MIDKFNQIIKVNQDELRYIKSRDNSSSFDKKILGTVDTAINRINNILLIFSQYPLMANNTEQELYQCQTALSELISYIKKMDNSSFLIKKYYQLRIHIIGKTQITKIKKLLNKVEGENK
jgi:hypothetical protein